MRIFAIGIAVAAAGIASAQEYWHFGSPFRMYGVYKRKYINPNQVYANGSGEQYDKAAAAFNANARNSYYDEATAHLEVKIQEVIVDGVVCKKYISRWEDLPVREDELRKIEKDYRLKYVLSKTTRVYESVIDPEGKIKLTYSDIQNGNGRIQVWTKFNKDEIQITVENKEGTRKLNVVPAMGVEGFINPIPAMLAAKENDRDPHKFSCIDPTTGGIVNYAVRYRTKFTGKIGQEKYAGKMFELETSTGKRLLFVSDKGELVQVDFDNERDYINAIFTTDLSKPPK